MLGGVGGRHASVRRRGSSPGVRRYAAGAAAADDSPPASPRPMRRRRAALAAQDHKTCALIHTRLKLGDIILEDACCIIYTEQPSADDFDDDVVFIMKVKPDVALVIKF
ncbi:hypothetical protein HF086_012522 [Spodoptera exigua]|uniref:Uncharacterized protein n=1 Tax=Spodoptera exigua TaxID=7107 RepID=A0A922N233_SPOEX|nr:hypothetical protein HF086_012522 [Spodoptera exigua]